MEEFSAEYIPSHAAMLRALPVASRELGLSSRRWMLVFFVVVFIAAALIGIAQPVGIPDWGIVAAFASATLVWCFVVMPLRRREMAARFDVLAPPIPTRLLANEAGVAISDAHSEVRWDWSQIRGAVKTADGVGILVGYGLMFIPKEAFANEAAQLAFLALVSGKSAGVPPVH